MPLHSSALSLNAFQLIETCDIEVMQQAMLDQFGAIKFDVSAGAPDFYAKGNYVRSGPIALGYCAYAGGASAEFPETDYLLLQMPIAGQARTTVGAEQLDIDTSRDCVTLADRARRIEFGVDFKQIFLRIEREALQDKLAALLGFRPKGRLSFDSNVNAEGANLDSLKSVIGFTARHLASISGLSEPPILTTKELQDTLVVAFLEVVPNNFSDLLRGDPLNIASQQVRAVEEFIESNWMLPITANSLAVATGIGARSIFRSFQLYRAYTPLQYVKMVRLD